MEPEICLDRLADRLRRWRSDRGLTLQQLADRSGVAASTIHKIEVRKTVPTVAVVCRIAQGLDLPMTEFVAEDPEPSGRVRGRGEALQAVADGVALAPLGAPDRDPRGYRVRLAGQPAGVTFHVQGALVVVCLDGAVEIAADAFRWPLDAGDVLDLRSDAPLHLGLHCRQTCHLLLLGDVPKTAQALLARPARVARSRPPLATSA